MRILTINYEYPPLGGGGGVAHKVLVDEWKRHHEVTLITTRGKGQRFSEYMHGIRVYRAPCFRRTASVPEVYSLALFLITPILWLLWLKIKRKKIDVINAQFAIPSGVIGIIAKYLFHVPCIVSIHGGDIYDPSKKVSPHLYWYTRWLVSWVLSHADRIIAQSHNTAQNAKAYYRFTQEIDIVPLPLAPAEPTQSQDDVDAPAYTFISIGRLVARKGFDYLIDAFARIHATRPDTTLCIIGRGPQEAELRARIVEKNLSSCAWIRTDVDDVLKYQLLRRASCYVLSSLHEGYGIVLQEAMNAGLPIVATNNGGQTDFLIHRKNALLCSPKDVDQLARCMQEMIEHPDFQQEAVARYAETLRSFEPERVARKTIELFSHL
ncbi:MAG: glycosyltransferase [Candidatus Kerfeldbacteria bacterium]|nr:glycosyltransferase [Candidatus Kerfeldbacteria bacterium]